MNPTYDLVAHIYRQRGFSRATYGPGPRTEGVTAHIGKELVEIRKAAEDYANSVGRDAKARTREELKYEWIDVLLLGLDGAWRAGFTPEEIVEALAEKQSRNELRDWPDWRTADPNKPIEHVRT